MLVILVHKVNGEGEYICFITLYSKSTSVKYLKKTHFYSCFFWLTTTLLKKISNKISLIPDSSLKPRNLLTLKIFEHLQSSPFKFDSVFWFSVDTQVPSDVKLKYPLTLFFLFHEKTCTLCGKCEIEMKMSLFCYCLVHAECFHHSSTVLSKQT